MMDQGVSYGLLNKLLPFENTTVFLVSYAGPDTPAGKLKKNAKVINTRYGKIYVKAKTKVYNIFSDHPDAKELLAWLSNQDKEKSCIDAAIAEVRKIELQINDLLSAEEQLDEEIKNLILEGEQKDKLRHQLQEQIRAELEPKLSALNKELNSFRITLGRQKVAELYDKVANTICAEMEETLDNVISKTII